jgi:hypothetical protein
MRQSKCGFMIARNKTYYQYEFGDDWRHEVVLEKIQRAESAPKSCHGCGGKRDIGREKAS